MTHKIQQLNKENTIGFSHEPGTDVGVDEGGNIAPGYQHHDALWWSGKNAVEAQRPPTLELEPTVAYFENLFTNIARGLLITYRPRTVLDLGCGSGLLCKKLRDLDPNMTTATVDANQLVKEKSPYVDVNHFTGRTDRRLDFRDEDGTKTIFDLVVSLEHFEHVSPESFDCLMENIVEHTKEGSHLVFTAASWTYEEEDQLHVHCNTKSEFEWVNYVESYGFELIPSPFPIQRAGDTAEIFMRRVK